LLVLGQVQEDLDDAGAVAVQVGLGVDDGLEAVAPEVARGEGLVGQLLAAQDLGEHAHDEHLLVVRAVEDADAAALGQRTWVRHRKSWSSSVGLGCLKLNTWQPCGLMPDMTWRMAPSLPAASMAWKITSSE